MTQFLPYERVYHLLDNEKIGTVQYKAVWPIINNTYVVVWDKDMPTDHGEGVEAIFLVSMHDDDDEIPL